MLHSALIAATLATCAFAVPQITSPAAGASVPGTGPVTVQWKDDGEAPKVTALQSFTLQLVVGGNTATDSAVIIGANPVTFGTATSTTITLSAGLADEVKNGFYFKMISVLKEGGVLTTYSDRFSLTGMTGTTDPSFVTAAADAGDKVPETVTPDTAPAADGAAGGDPDVPYASQTGLMRFAPMQSVPPTKITKKDTKPLYPTSSYKIATAFLPTPIPTKTQTASQTFSADSMENTASPVPGPAGDAQRFLNRWKD